MAFDFSKIEDEELRKELEAEFEKANSKEGLFTQSDLDRKINEVSQKIHKDEREIAEKLRKEIEEESKLNIEEKAQKIMEQMAEREKTLAKRENRFEALNKLTEKGVDPNEVSEMIDLLVTDDKHTTEERVATYLKTVEGMKEKLKEDIIKQTPDPTKGGGQNGVVDKAKFDAMTYAEKLEFKEKNPELFTKHMAGK